MRIGEVLKLTMNDIHDQKLILQDPKSSREYEYVFIPVKVAERLREYAKSVSKSSDERMFPIKR
jgi:integrase